MMRKTILLAPLLLLLGAVSLVGLLPQSGHAGNTPSTAIAEEVYTGNLVYVGGSRGAITSTFTLRIKRYTPDSEVLRLTQLLKDSGQDALSRALDKEDLGNIQIGVNVGQTINAAWVSTGEEGERQITVLSKRWIGTFEHRRGTRSLDYPFTYVELFVDERGRGDGGMIPAAKVRARGDRTIEVENFGIYPARLTNIKRRLK
jgi:hypothetical protein